MVIKELCMLSQKSIFIALAMLVTTILNGCNTKDKIVIIEEDGIKELKVGMAIEDADKIIDLYFNTLPDRQTYKTKGEDSLHIEHKNGAFAMIIIWKKGVIITMLYSSVENYNKSKYTGGESLVSVFFDRKKVIKVK